jgi:hypothetical protein
MSDDSTHIAFPHSGHSSSIFDGIKRSHPVGPWSIAIFDPQRRKVIGRKTFQAHEPLLMVAWLQQLNFDGHVQWSVLSGAKR